MAYDSDGNVVVLFRGNTSDELSNKTWEWDGNEWTLVAESGPSPRFGAAMVYDSRRHVSVLFGGVRRLSDMWEWDGSEWSLVQASGPSGRSFPATAFDSLRGEIVLFGGYGSVGDTWVYRDGRWVYVTSRGPSQREGPTMVYDEVRDAFVLYGGLYDDNKNETVYAQTWILNTDGWHLAPDATPGPLVYQAMSYEKDRGVVLMHGGSHSGRDDTNHNELWMWDGSHWNLLSENGPTPRKSHAMVYDASRQSLVLFGGWDNEPGIRGDTWEFAAVVEPALALQTSCPESGPAELTWTCASRNGRVGLVFGRQLGSYQNPQGQPCAGTFLELDSQGLVLLGAPRSNASGSGSIGGSLSTNVCGGYVQLIDAATCALSGVVRVE